MLSLVRQEKFMEVYGTSPTKFLKSVRLLFILAHYIFSSSATEAISSFSLLNG